MRYKTSVIDSEISNFPGILRGGGGEVLQTCTAVTVQVEWTHLGSPRMVQILRSIKSHMRRCVQTPTVPSLIHEPQREDIGSQFENFCGRRGDASSSPSDHPITPLQQRCSRLSLPISLPDCGFVFAVINFSLTAAFSLPPSAPPLSLLFANSMRSQIGFPPFSL